MMRIQKGSVQNAHLLYLTIFPMLSDDGMVWMPSPTTSFVPHSSVLSSVPIGKPVLAICHSTGIFFLKPELKHTPHWLINLSSLPLRVYNSRETTSHILEAAPNSDKPMLFALSTDGNTSSAGSSTTERVNAAVGRSTAGSARLGVAPMRANGDYGAAVTLLSARTAAAP